MIRIACLVSVITSRSRVLLSLAAALLLSGGCSPAGREGGAPSVVNELFTQCSALAGQIVGGAAVSSSELVIEGEPLIGLVNRLLIKWFVPGFTGVEAPQTFCRLSARISTSDSSSVAIEAWLPALWNSKILGVGGGGFNGGLGPTAPLAMASPLAKGYMSFVTDAGHEKTDSAKFAFDNPEQLNDFAYRANQVAAVFAQSLAVRYYGISAEKAYFHGCSNGGRDALMLAQRSPNLYDGIIAGAPAANWSKLMATFAWWRKIQFSQANNGETELKSKLGLITAAVLDKCDKLDGLKDGILNNPLQCDFDPSDIQCRGETSPSCLSKRDVELVQNLYRGPQLPGGEAVYRGLPPGGEALKNNWDLWVTKKSSPGISMSTETLRWMVYRDESWSPDDFDLVDALMKAEQTIGPLMNASDPDLSAFFAKNGKLIIYHGWNDAAIPATATIDYYEAVKNSVGRRSTEESARLFLVPGMQHCFGGVGPSSFDMLDALDHWVDSGRPPNSIVARQYSSPSLLPELNVDGALVLSRPLCPWPLSAHYKGAGDVSHHTSFECR